MVLLEELMMLEMDVELVVVSPIVLSKLLALGLGKFITLSQTRRVVRV